MGRLFWKIFLWFWLALLLLNFAVGWGVKIYLEQTRQPDGGSLQTRVEALALAFEHENRTRARTLLEEMHRDDHLPVFVIDESGRDLLDRPLPPFLESQLSRGDLDPRQFHLTRVALPSGERYQVIAPRQSFSRRLASTPVWLALAITLVISTLVCYGLARYLSNPVRKLSSATRRLSGGDLGVRVGRLKRRDEIADLAGDFDRMADKIQQLLDARKQLLEDVSHELRSPLARLQVALALAVRNDPEGRRETEFQRIGRDLDRLESLIGEILALSRLNTITYDQEELPLTELVEEILEDCRREAGIRDCTIETQLTPGVTFYGSRELLRRAVENLVRNAVQFSNAGGQVDVRLTENRDRVEIRVGDRGPGIPEGSAEVMFEPFVRIDPARQRQSGGHGLGLAIARKAVELHGGHIAAANRSGGGLEIRITLPKA